MGNQVKVSKSGAVCLCHMGRADVGVPLALCGVHTALVTARPRRVLSIGAAERSAERGAKEVDGGGGNGATYSSAWMESAGAT